MRDKTGPTPERILKVVSEYDAIGEKAFLKKYEKGAAPERWLLRIDGKLYPLKALWVAAHEPPENPSKLDYRKAFLPLRDMGFFDFVTVGEEDTPPIQ